jgi:hypothetical protein
MPADDEDTINEFNDLIQTVSDDAAPTKLAKALVTQVVISDRFTLPDRGSTI